MRLSGPLLWLAFFLCLWTSSLAGVKELRLPVPTRETIALVAREMGAATFEESLEVEEPDSLSAASAPARRVQRKLATGGEDIDDNAEYQEYQGVMGRPGVDFPVLPSIPSTSFSCRAVRRHGYFADLDTDCQVFHICDGGRKISFLCPNGTIFRQSHLICDWWFRVDCGKSVELYEESAEQLAADQRIYRQRAEAISKAISKADGSQSSSSTTLPPRPSAGPESHIDAPAFETAKLNYENRQSVRRQSSSRRRQQRPRTEKPQTDQSGNQQQHKISQDLRANRPAAVDDDKEQQILSETASFASGRGNRFSQQFFQDENLSGSPTPQNSVSSTKNDDQELQKARFIGEIPQNSRFPQNSPTPSSPTFGDYVSSTQVTRSTSQRSTFRGNGRLLPTSSQNNNFRPSSSKSGVFKNGGQSVGNEKSEPKQQFVTPKNSQTPQNNFVRPSPDLEPPKSVPSLVSRDNILNSQSESEITSNNNRNYVQLNRNRQPTSSTPRISTPNRVQSSVIPPSAPEEESQNRLKQRRFTSTTEKPVFTVKFRPSKAFSYVELERTQTSSDSDLSSRVPHSSTTTAQPQYLSSSSYQLKNNNTYFSPSTKAPVTPDLSVSYSTSSFSEKFQSSKESENTFSYDQTIVTEDPIINNERETEWTPTRYLSQSTSDYSFTSSSPTPSYSPTIPDKNLNGIVAPKLPSSTPFLIISRDETPLPKLPNFRNIDPAEINLLPFKQNSKSRPNLNIPESAGPNALHTLALYYATSESDSVTTPAYVSKDTTSPEFTKSEASPILKSKTTEFINQKTYSKVSDEILLRSHSGSPDGEAEIDDAQAAVEPSDNVKGLPTVLTKATKDSFAFLFNDTNVEKSKTHTDDNPCNGDDVYDLDATKESVTEREIQIKDDIKNDLDSEQSRGIVQPTPKPTVLSFPSLEELPEDLKLKDSTDLRELAQVFSRALSAYLEDPDSFRRILSEVRPTEPTSLNAYGTTMSLEENEDEVLDFSDASSGPRLSNNVNMLSNQKDRINQIDIEQINDLVQSVNNTYPELSRDLTAPKEEYFDNFDSQRYSTQSAIALAADINLLSRDANNSVSDTRDEKLLSTAGEVDDNSRPRYGGFHNNSAGPNYKAYGSDVPAEVTGKPLIETTYVPDWPTTATITDESEGIGFISDGFIKESNQIEIESIPDKLGIVPAEDINSLADSQKDCDDSLKHLDETDNGAIGFTKRKQTNIEDETYDKSDPEKLLITSGSQSFVSRDNYVRFLGAKQSLNSNSNGKSSQLSKDIPLSTTTERTESERFASTQPKRGSVRFGPSNIPPDSSTFRRRTQKELAFQNIDLGNGVTLERTKTIRYSTPKLREFSSTSTALPAISKEAKYTTLGESLEIVADGVSATTEYPFDSLPSTVNVIRATTYHPNSAENPELPEIITRRGSLHNNWQWNAQPSNDLINTPVEDNKLLSTPSQSQTQTVVPSFSSFASTLLPSNITSEAERQEMLERKAEEIFGNLNDTSADMLMNVMNEAESNTTVRRLVLLLVADRNGRDNKSLEESRSQLIQALLKTSETTPAVEHVTEPQVLDRVTQKGIRPRGRAFNPDSTPTTPQVTTASRDNSQTTTQVDPEYYQRSQQKPEAQYLRSPNLFPQKNSASNFGTDPDARAVELLKSLYNLAARWG